MSTILIGIAGGTGSGKTTLTRHLKEHFGPEVTVIGHDNYYKRQDGKTLEERAKVNYDHPAAFDTELLIEHLKELKEGRPIRCPVYSYVEHNRTEETREILPTKVIIVEGILIFQNPTLRDMFDIKIFVETDADVRRRCGEAGVVVLERQVSQFIVRAADGKGRRLLGDVAVNRAALEGSQ